jgi:DNA-binding FrmR family transcriptional regulator
MDRNCDENAAPTSQPKAQDWPRSCSAWRPRSASWPEQEEAREAVARGGEKAHVPPEAALATKRAILHRLRRIEGQVRGLQRMLEEERDCAEILPQFAAIMAAMKRVVSLLAYAALRERLTTALAAGRDPDAAVRELLEMLARLP